MAIHRHQETFRGLVGKRLGRKSGTDKADRIQTPESISTDHHNWLCEKHAHGSAQVFLNQLAEIDFNFFLLCVNTPVLGSAPKLSSLVDKNHRWRQPRKDGNTEDSNGDTSLSIVEHVGKYSSNDATAIEKIEKPNEAMRRGTRRP
ncbi:hypothetical protein KCU85_g122, partial [Aureobasidium melanogenum]